MKTHLFIGGGLHGTRQAIPDGHDRYMEYALYDARRSEAAWREESSFADPLSVRIKYDTYERRPLCLGNNCRIQLMVLRGLSDDAMMRRVADVLEGV